MDENCATTVPPLHAIGDAERGPMLAHNGDDEGVMVVEIIAGQHGRVNDHAIPWAIYSMPEIA